MIRTLIALVFYLAVLGPGHPAQTGKAEARWAAMPSAPRPAAMYSGHDARLARASFDTHAPAVRSMPVSRGWRRMTLRREERARVQWLEFDPLHRRPPPSFF